MKRGNELILMLVVALVALGVRVIRKVIQTNQATETTAELKILHDSSAYLMLVEDGRSEEFAAEFEHNPACGGIEIRTESSAAFHKTLDGLDLATGKIVSTTMQQTWWFAAVPDNTAVGFHWNVLSNMAFPAIIPGGSKKAEVVKTTCSEITHAVPNLMKMNHAQPISRFTPIGKDGFESFDTVTGQNCISSASYPNPYAKYGGTLAEPYCSELTKK